MHRAVMLLPLAHSAAPLPLPCGLFIISVPPPSDCSLSYVWCGHQRDTFLFRSGRQPVCLCECKHVIHVD